MALHPSALPILVTHHHRLRGFANTAAPVGPTPLVANNKDDSRFRRRCFCIFTVRCRAAEADPPWGNVSVGSDLTLSGNRRQCPFCPKAVIQQESRHWLRLAISRLGGAGHASSPASGYAGFAFRLQLARGPEQQRQHHASPAPPTPRRLYRSLRLLPGSGACPSYRWATPPALPAASLVRAI